MVWPFKASPTPFLPEPAREEKKDDPPPRFVDEGRFNQALEEVRGLNSKLDQFTGMFAGFMQGGQGGQGGQRTESAPPAEAAIDDITDEEYNDAVLRGDPVKISKRMNAVAERKVRETRKEYDTRLKALETQGMAVLDQVSGELGQSSLASQPYYALLKTDIDAAMKQIQPHMRTPEMRMFVYNAVVGTNLDKIRAHDAAEAARIQRDREQPDPPGRGRTQEDQGPTPESVFGADMLRPDATWRGGARLWDKRSPDGFAQNRYGTKDLKEAAVYATNVMNLDDCPRCFGPIIGGKCHCRG